MFWKDRLRKIEVDENVIPIELTIEGLIDSDQDRASYNSLTNKPTINGHTITGDMTNEDIGIPTKASDLIDDGKYLTEQKQADWNENDTSSPAYIKNRPLYINDRVEDKSILGGNYTVKRFTEIGLGYKEKTDTLLVAYDKYKITWDGTTYYMTAFPAGGTRVFIGNINEAPYFRIETYQDLEGEKYIMIDYPSDADAVHSIYLSSLKSENVVSDWFSDIIDSKIKQLSSVGYAVVDKAIVAGKEVEVFNEIFLRSPNKIWKITMKDSGEFVTQEV